MLNDLCLVSDARDVLGLQSGTDVALVARYVSAASAFFERETNRVFRPTLYTERRNGTGTEILVLKNYPGISLESLLFDGQAQTLTDFVLDVATLWGTKKIFPKGIQNVVAQYWAGFGAKITESGVVTDQKVIVSQGDWFYLHVSVLDGTTPMTKVNAAPAAGQFTVTDTGEYGFNAADNGKTVTITYWYKAVPSEMQQAIIEIVTSRYRRKSHIDQDSQNMNGQVISFSRLDVPPEVRKVIEDYKMRGLIT